MPKIFYIQYTNPANYPPLEHSGLILQRAGWGVSYFGIESEGASSKLTFSDSLAENVRLWKRQPLGWRQKWQFLRFTLVSLLKAWWQAPEWIYCSDFMSCPAAWLVGKLTRVRVLYHEHDSPETKIRNSEVGGRTKVVSCFKRMLLWFRREVGREADLVVFPNAKRLGIFVKECGRKKPSHVVFNCPRKEEAEDEGETRQQRGADSKLRLFFHGSLNYEQPPPLILDAMSKMTGPITLTVAGYSVNGCRDSMEIFLQKARTFGVEANVKFLGALPRHELMRRVHDADLGLSMFPLVSSNVNLEFLTGASNKPFDYLACGLALLVSARPDWEEMYVRPGYGLACNPADADSIANQLRWFLMHPSETRAMGKAGRQRIESEWHYENQFAPVLKLLNSRRTQASIT